MKLDAWLRQDHPLADRLRLVERLSQALNAVHDRGEILAALEPAAGRGRGRPPVRPLGGRARLAGARLRGSGAHRGGPPSPEADVYSAGAIAWEVLVGRPCGELPAPLSDVAPRPAARARERGHGVPGALAAVAPEGPHLPRPARGRPAEGRARGRAEPDAASAPRAGARARRASRRRTPPKRPSRSHLPLLIAALLWSPPRPQLLVDPAAGTGGAVAPARRRAARAGQRDARRHRDPAATPAPDRRPRPRPGEVPTARGPDARPRLRRRRPTPTPDARADAGRPRRRPRRRPRPRRRRRPRPRPRRAAVAPAPAARGGAGRGPPSRSCPHRALSPVGPPARPGPPRPARHRAPLRPARPRPAAARGAARHLRGAAEVGERQPRDRPARARRRASRRGSTPSPSRTRAAARRSRCSSRSRSRRDRPAALRQRIHSRSHRPIRTAVHSGIAQRVPQQLRTAACGKPAPSRGVESCAVEPMPNPDSSGRRLLALSPRGRARRGRPAVAAPQRVPRS